MKKNLLLTLLFAFAAFTAVAKEKIRVACVGNSVTYGYLLPEREKNCYPARLQTMLGDNYDVRNFGHSGATLLNKGHRPYMKLPEFRAAVDYKADIVVIHLGLNDTDPRNWPNYSEEFIPDYRAMIDSFRTANPKAKIWICEMTPIFHGHSRFDSGTREWHEQIQESIVRVAKGAGTGLIDLYTPLHKRPDLFPDALHPNPEGALILAQTVYAALTGNYGGLSLPPVYSDGMVMQREQPFCISGMANAGEKVSVDFLGRKTSVRANERGEWTVAYAAQKASGPHVLSVKAKSGEVTVSDIYFGEVWLCSGQSNMEFRLGQIKTAKEDLAAATSERIRFYNMPQKASTNAVEWDKETLDLVNALHFVQPSTWEKCTPEAAAKFSAIGYHFGRILADSLDCHIGLICNAVGGSATENWIDRGTLEREISPILRNWRGNDYIQPWVRERANQNTKQATDKLQRHPYEPAYLFESAMLPLEHLPGLRGVIWYQGESNAHNVELHERLFTLLESSWRAFFNDADLPFYFVQLSSIGTRPSWCHFRDSQRRLAESLPYTWMAVSSDKGDYYDVHPRDKRDIGLRLAFQALKHSYGRSGICSQGPTFRSMTVEGADLRLYFDNAEGLRGEKGEITGFEVAGEDGIYHPAKAVVSGKTLLVRSTAVAAPRAVRYGWKPFTEANLVNAAGFPCSTFRTSEF